MRESGPTPAADTNDPGQPSRDFSPSDSSPPGDAAPVRPVTGAKTVRKVLHLPARMPGVYRRAPSLRDH